MFDFLFKRKPFPPFFEQYTSLFQRKADTSLPIGKTRFVVLDTETTGLNVQSDKLLSIAAIGVVDGQMNMADYFDCFVSQDVKTGESAPVHGILRKDIQHGLTEQEAMQQVLAFCRDSVIVGQHIGFDVAMLNAALAKMDCGKLLNKTLDTAKMAARVEKPFQSYHLVMQEGGFGLDDLCKRYNIPVQERHTAAGDVYITGVLFLKLLARLRQRGIFSIGELLGGN